MELPTDPDILVGLASADDAGVLRITPDLAMITTVDFFTPIVDDPFLFGQIAVVNALSDVYAMGGVPRTALNLVGFPTKKMEMDILQRILAGGLDKLKEAGVLLLGGHSIEDPELKYGISVTGFVHPDKVLANRGLQSGDVLVLTKPIGTGVLATAVKADLAPPEAVTAMQTGMATLNREAAEGAADLPVHACTDITGFGLLGHLAEMVVGDQVGVELDAAAVPLLPGAIEAASMGMVPAGAYANRAYRENMVKVIGKADPVRMDLLFDPQTSGGLLFSLPPAAGAGLIEKLAAREITGATIGVVTPTNPGQIVVSGF